MSPIAHSAVLWPNAMKPASFRGRVLTGYSTSFDSNN